MGDDELISFIKNSRERGRIDEQITQQLLSVGWRKDKIEEAFLKIKEHKAAEKRILDGMQSERQEEAASLQQPAHQQSTPAQQQAAAQQPVSQQFQPMQQPAQQPIQQPQATPAQPAQKSAGFAPPSFGLFGKRPQQPAQPQPSIQQPQSAAQPQTAGQPAYSQPSSQPSQPGAWRPMQQPAAWQPAQPQSAAQPQPAASQPVSQPASKPGFSFSSILPKKKEPADSSGLYMAQGQQAPAQPPQQAAPVAEGQPQAAQGGLFANKLLVYAIVIILALVVAGMIYFVFMIPGQTQTVPKKSTTPKAPVPSEAPPSEQGEPAANASAPLSCDEMDIGCLIAASKDCTPAHTSFVHSANSSGMETTRITFMEIKGMNGTDCLFYAKNEDVRVRFTNQKIGEMVVNGSTIEEITKLEMGMEKSAESLAGLESTCRFRPGELAGLLTLWSQNGVSEMSNAASICNGTLFGKAG